MKKIAIYGGTFDPIHHGHLILARETCESLSLHKLIFVPAALSPHKLDRVPTSSETRLEMLRVAIAGEERFFLDDCELHRSAPSYSIDTVEQIQEREGDAEYFFLIGSDNCQRLETWHRFRELRERVQFVILARRNITEGEATTEEYPIIHRQIDISATDIRNRVATGRSIRYLVPPAVEEIIRRRQIYQEQEK